MYKNSLILNSWETHREKHFNSKFKNLLNYFPKERIVENHSNLSDLEDIFTDESLNFVDILHILTKKYYLSNVSENSINKEFNDSIKRLDFEYAHSLLMINNDLRKMVIYNYIDNINVTNNYLAIEKTAEHDYEEVNQTLEELNNFYLVARFKDISSHKVLKKSYN